MTTDLEKHKRWRDANREHVRANGRERMRAWRLRNPELTKERARISMRRTLMKRIGVTEQDVENRLAEQDYQCAMCLRTHPGGRGTWHIDHCHETNRFRGLLCTRCNVLLGMAGDDPAVLLAGIEYLTTHKK